MVQIPTRTATRGQKLCHHKHWSLDHKIVGFAKPQIQPARAHTATQPEGKPKLLLLPLLTQQTSPPYQKRITFIDTSNTHPVSKWERSY